MHKEDKAQESFFSGYLYDQAVPKCHFLRKLSGAIDFRFAKRFPRKA